MQLFYLQYGDHKSNRLFACTTEITDIWHYGDWKDSQKKTFSAVTQGGNGIVAEIGKENDSQSEQVGVESIALTT